MTGITRGDAAGPRCGRVAALYDIHGNLPALQAVLGEVEDAAPALVVIGGDVATGPFPVEATECLMELDLPARFVMGNSDREVIDSFAGSSQGDQSVELATRWCAEMLSERHIDFFRSFENTVSLDVGDLGPVLFCHGSPRSDLELITSATPGALIEPMLEGVDASTVVCGHTHMQFDRLISGTRVVNAGSVGMPYERAPGAYWAMVGRTIEHRHTPYDLEGAAAMIRLSGWPMADEFLRDNVLTVPTPEEAIAVFEPSSMQRSLREP
jgi:predicted phosphodiesterase